MGFEWMRTRSVSTIGPNAERIDLLEGIVVIPPGPRLVGDKLVQKDGICIID